MDYRTTLSVAVGVFTFLLGALFAVVLEAEHAANTGDPTWLPYVADSPAVTVILYDNVVMVAGFVLSPLLVVAVGFAVGRGLDLPDEYRGVLGALVVGSARAVLAGFAGAALGFVFSSRSREEPEALAGTAGTKPAP